MTPEEIREQAWREIIVGAQSYRAENEHIRIGLKAVFAELDKVENQTYLRGYEDDYAAGVKDASE